MIKHAVWPTRASDVCTAYWDQNAWDAFAEYYRPSGYTGGIHDDRAFIIWCAQRCIEQAREATKRIAKQSDGLVMADRILAAGLRDALRAAEVCKQSRRGSFCEIGTCLACTTARLNRGETAL